MDAAILHGFGAFGKRQQCSNLVRSIVSQFRPFQWEGGSGRIALRSQAGADAEPQTDGCL
jgi:hypothetical protein